VTKREKQKLAFKKWYDKNKEQEAIRHKVYNDEHKEEKVIYNKEYRETHETSRPTPDESRVYNRKRYTQYREEIIRKNKAYAQTREGRETRRKTGAKRRSFGFIPINEPFENCEGHHIDKEHIVYIPKELHKSIPHCLKTGYNMSRINILAFWYYLKDFSLSKSEKSIITI